MDDVEVPIDDCEAYTSYVIRRRIEWVVTNTLTVVPEEEEPPDAEEVEVA